MTRGVITLVFDDGYQNVFDNAVPLLRANGLHAVFALPLNGSRLQRNRESAIKPWPQWLSLGAEGHELASHSVNHTDLTKISQAELERELREPSQSLGATTLVYPGGAFNTTVVNAARAHYTAGRTVIRGFETIPPRDPMRLQSFNFTIRNFSVWKANVLAAWTFLANSWLIETYHLVDDDGVLKHRVRTRDLKKHLEFIARLPVSVRTIREVVQSSRV